MKKDDTKKVIILAVLLIISTILTGCVNNSELEPNVWRKGIFEEIKVGNTSTRLTINLTDTGTYTYVFKEKLDTLDLEKGEYYEFGIHVVAIEEKGKLTLIEVYDTDLSLVWSRN